MTFVATINGVQVHSSKQVLNIINSRVEFVDGSWCDVATGQIVNRGEGEISFDSAVSDKSGNSITKGPERFSASNLELRQIFASVNVEPHLGSDMEVTISGPENVVSTIRTRMHGQTLVIESSSPPVKNDRTTVISGSSGVVMRNVVGVGNSISIGGSSGGNSTKVTVKVPLGTPISVTSMSGNTQIGDIMGPLTARVIGANNIMAGRMTNVELHVRGRGDIRVAEVSGSAVAHIMGSGDITIEGGTMNNLSVNVMGSGDVTVDGVAQRASLNIMGSGEIHVAHVVEAPVNNVMGFGKIRVRRVG